KYFGLIFEQKQIEQLNMWGIKRFFVEKALEIMDSFPTDGEDLYKWYAHLSSQLARESGIAWKNKTRQSVHLQTHYLWAQNVPLQHIKSEVIIKLHKFFNSLN
ncbi:MAG: hypothetical protein KDC67_14030, partial [Ignavibacteriae bacterium]|nr:hypothetical protein [Ignavibacteriota bacterium]